MVCTVEHKKKLLQKGDLFVFVISFSQQSTGCECNFPLFFLGNKGGKKKDKRK